jgi:diguanylate cyclase (GGDEF)-like protein
MATNIRAVIKITGTAFAVLIGLILPFGYAADDYLEARDHARLEAHRSATKVAKYVYNTGPLWSYTPLRLQDILADRPLEERNETRQQVVSLNGQLIYAEAGEVATPVLKGRAPIELAGETVGWVEARESLRPLIAQTGVVTLLSAVLGAIALLLFRVFPLRVLDRTLARLGEREAELRSQYVISDSALNSMSQGLCMFDADRRLITCNRRFGDLYKLPSELTQPGTPLSAILEYRVRTGSSSKSPETYVGDRLDMVTMNHQQIDIVEQMDGRTIEILFDPLPGGGWVATHEDITARRQSEARIAYLATHDSLTELPNRVLFREQLEIALRGISNGSSFAVHSLDIDRFKEVNDSLGHPIGDALLQEVARRLRAELRDADLVARLGGDEFAVIQMELERPEAASDLAERLIGVIGAPYVIEGHHLEIGASVGVTIAPGDSIDADQLLRNADMALYRAKGQGRGTFRFFEQEMDTRLQARRLLEQELRAALKGGEFEVYYQPLFNIVANEICGFEALLRWHNPKRGMVPPDDFIPMAEETGLIVPIGDWVLRQACAEAAKWPSGITVAVNLSPVQFKSRGLLESVVGALAASQLSPDRLELEITETVLLQEGTATLATLHKLRALGIRIAMDDFGTGYSSLSYLRSFPFDKIKIDRSFVQHLASERDSNAIVRAVTGLAHDLGMTSTAEGVESQETLDILRENGCTEIQGYLISAAAPAHTVPELLIKFGGGLAPSGMHAAIGRQQRIA